MATIIISPPSLNQSVMWRVGLLAILLLAAGTRLWRINSWPIVLFDEAYYASAAVQYLAGQPFLFSHPPLVPLQYAALAYTGGATGGQLFRESLLPYGQFPYALLRAGSAGAGVLLVLVITLLAKTITGSPVAGLLAGLMAALDNSLVLYARLILPDTWLLLYGLLGLWCFLRAGQTPYRSRRWYRWLLCASVMFGLAVSVKATGFFFPALAFIYSLRQLPRYGAAHPSRVALCVFVIPLLVVLSVTLLHWLLFDAVQPVLLNVHGQPDPIINTIRLRNPLLPRHPLLGRITQRLAETAVYYLHTIGGNYTFRTPHSASSPWWLWPFMQKPMTLVALAGKDGTREVIFTGNPVIWWGGLSALALISWQRLRRRWP
ncbi:MAG: phospholipid carrier-dependent glycosyltransferase, partial [Candidatus Andersenbacteria bacterium]|nr:phospholipid carrier-dependent glycosyltransferase [Candidatus Andersenbacteria bacterium]